MNLVDRAKNILLTPKTEWEIINGETSTPMSLVTSYVLPLAVIASLGGIVGFFIGATVLGIKFAIGTALVGLIVSVVVFFALSYIVDMLAPSFSSEKDLGKSAQLVAYSGTAAAVASILGFIPFIGWLIAILGWGYGIYLTYIGLGPLKKTPEDKKVVYVLVIFVIWAAIYFILAAILAGILFTALGGIAAVGLRGY